MEEQVLPAYSVSEQAKLLQGKLLATVHQSPVASTSSLDAAETNDQTALHEARFALLQSTATLVTQLRAVARQANDDVRRGKRKVADARANVDVESLALQNLKYQQRHLQDEIRTCRDFRSVYQDIPLTSLQDFKARAPAEDTTDDVCNDPHRLQLARLRFELTERKRLEAERADVQAQRASLLRENNAKKQRLEGLESDLKVLLDRSVPATRRRFQEAREADAQAAAAASGKDMDGQDEQGDAGAASSYDEGHNDGHAADEEEGGERGKRADSIPGGDLTMNSSSTTTAGNLTPARTPRE